MHFGLYREPFCSAELLEAGRIQPSIREQVSLILPDALRTRFVDGLLDRRTYGTRSVCRLRRLRSMSITLLLVDRT
jgi:hypothetical protein